ncbi:MAG: glycoside hydrolase family 3 C-terminal domain-containing protein, partial [Clostridiales bacterium]|nr:glycoside hydrolase family 3 C-terminal domain-containing protein [Clostridiales bacterium]
GGTGINFEQLFSDLYSGYAKDNGYTSTELDNTARLFFEDDKLTEHEKSLRDHIREDLKAITGDDMISPGCYPPGIVLGSTWDPEVIRRTGEALGYEAQRYRIGCLLGTPNVNLLREPRNGRFFEGYSEDPYLAGQLAKEFVKGVESTGVASNVKHYAANNLEINRIGIDEHIGERALREMYLPAFRECVSAGVSTVMAAYPSINGKKCVENRELLRDILKEEWEFNGPVMTDWGACTGKTGDALGAGTDIFMPGPWDSTDIIDAVKDGRVTSEELDDAVRRVLELTEKCEKISSSLSYEEYIEKGDRAAYKAALEGIVLLRNDGVLPLSPERPLFVFGRSTLRDCGSGSAQVFTDRYHDLRDCLDISSADDLKAWEDSPSAVALVVCSLPSAEGTDRADLEMDDETKKILKYLISAKKQDQKVILILNVPGPVVLTEFIDDTDAVILTYYPGMMGAKALSDIMTGKVSPSGKLTVTWPLRYEDTPAFLNYPDGFTCNYGEGIFVGYRGYEKRKIIPLFPFGFGLTYSRFAISDVRVDQDRLRKGDEIIVRCTLRNEGSVDAAEVVQVYVGDLRSRLNKPVKELKAFGRYFLRAGESRDITFSIRTEDLASYDEDFGRFLVEDGIYEIYVGTSSADIKGKTSITLVEGDEEYRLGTGSTVGEIREYKDLWETLLKDIEDHGLDISALVAASRYVPSMKILEVYPEATDLTGFIAACSSKVRV